MKIFVSKLKLTPIAAILFLLGCGGGSTTASELQQIPCEPTVNTWAVTGQRSLNNTLWGWQKVSNTKRLGEFSQRFEVRPGDCSSDAGWSDCNTDRERSEITVDQYILPGQQVSVAWSMNLPSTFEDSATVKTTLGQLHQRAWFKNGPLLQFDLQNGQYVLCIHRLSGNIQNVNDVCEFWHLANLSDLRGKWTDIQFEINTNTSNGWLKVWVNGELKVYTTQPPAVFDPSNYYFKYGIYRSFVSRHNGPMPTQVAYFDEVRQAPRAGLISANCNNNAVD